MRFVAEEVREYLAALGFRTLDEAIGHAELIDPNPPATTWKTDGIDLTPILHMPDMGTRSSCTTRDRRTTVSPRRSTTS